jgi:hypothetical protein
MSDSFGTMATGLWSSSLAKDDTITVTLGGDASTISLVPGTTVITVLPSGGVSDSTGIASASSCGSVTLGGSFSIPAISTVDLTLDENYPGATTTLTLSFISAVEIADFDFIVLTFPSTLPSVVLPEHGYILKNGVVTYDVLQLEPLFGVPIAVINATTRTLSIQKVGGASIFAGQRVTVEVKFIGLPNILETLNFFSLSTVTRSGAIKSINATVPGLLIENTFAPVFDTSVKEVRFDETWIYEETTAPGAFTPTDAFTALATDIDGGSSGAIVYSLSSGNTSVWAIDPTTGVISSLTYLDHESDSRIYNITIRATDSAPPFRFTDFAFGIVLVDVNDHTPVFVYQDAVSNNYGIDFSELSTVGTIVTDVNITATDGDSGSNSDLRYSIAGAMGYFTIGDTTGRLTLVKRITRSVISLLRLNVTVTDLGVPARLSETFIIINVISEDVLVYINLDIPLETFELVKDMFLSVLSQYLCPTGQCKVVFYDVQPIDVNVRRATTQQFVFMFNRFFPSFYTSVFSLCFISEFQLIVLCSAGPKSLSTWSIPALVR